MKKIPALLIAHLELLLAAMSIPVVTALHYLVSVQFENPWKITAAAALSVGVLHGFIAWFVRERQRSVRLQILQGTAAILQQKTSIASHGGPIARLTEYEVRLAQAQLVALVRDPLIIRSTATASSGPIDLERLNRLKV